MYWNVEFRDNGGNTFNNHTLKYHEEAEALACLYAYYCGEYGVDYETMTGIAVVEVDDEGNERDIALIVRDEDDDWQFDQGSESEIYKQLEKYYLYLKKKSKVCNFSCDDEEETYYLLNNIL